MQGWQSVRPRRDHVLFGGHGIPHVSHETTLAVAFMPETDTAMAGPNIHIGRSFSRNLPDRAVPQSGLTDWKHLPDHLHTS